MAAKSQRGKPKIDIRLDENIIQKLEKLASEKEKTVSYVVRQAISEYLVRENITLDSDKDTHKEIIYPKATEKAKK